MRQTTREITTDDVAAMLSHVPADDRETWVLMAMAVKAGLGDDGWHVWDQWSRRSDRYKERDAAAVWRSVRSHGPVTAGTLVATARDYGWDGATTPVFPARADSGQRAAAEAAQRDRAAGRATRQAEQMVRSAAQETGHPYLVAKGFPEEPALVLDGALLVPMYNAATGRLSSLQTISAAGEKKFLYGGRASGAVHRRGFRRARHRFYCEGLSTALSIEAAARILGIQAEVVICFSAGNMPRAVGSIGPGVVVADHDLWTCPACKMRYAAPAGQCPGCGDAARQVEPAGAKYARRTGMYWWQPPHPDTDANDYARDNGIAALARALKEIVYPARRGA